MSGRDFTSPRPRTKPMANTEDEMSGRGPGAPPSSPDIMMSSPIVPTKVRSKIPRSSKKRAERAFPTTPSYDIKQQTEGHKNMEKQTPSGKLSIVGKPTSANKGGTVGKIEIRLPEERPATQPMSSGIGGRYNHQLETAELRTLLKLPRDTPSAQVVHKLREAFHFMDIVERYRSDLQRLLQNKEAKTHEGMLKTVKELLMENESLKQNIDRHQEIIAKLQEDKRLVLERFHKLVKEHRIKDYGSGSLLALPQNDSKFTSQDARLGKSRSGTLVASAGNLLPAASFTELTVAGTGERKDLGTMLSSRIDHMLRPNTTNQTNPEHKDLSPIYIRHRKNKDEKKMVYKITGVIRPASSVSSLDDRPKTRGSTTVLSTTNNTKKLPEIFARKKTPTPTQKLKMLMDSDTASNAAQSSLTSVTEASTSTIGGNDSEFTSDTIRTTSRGGSAQRRIRIRTMDKGLSYEIKPKSSSNLVSMSKRYSSSALSAGGSVGHHIPPPPSSIAEQEESMGDVYGNISDIKKDDIINLIFAPLLKDRYMSKFTVGSPGGVLTMSEIGVSLVVPPGAIPTGQSTDIILGVSYNPIDTPLSPYTCTNTSSTILCAAQPPDITFKRPVLLTFAHNAGNTGLAKGPRGTPRLLQSFSDIGHTTSWTDFVNHEDEGEREFGCVTSEHCVMYLTELRLVAMVMEQGVSRLPSKSVRVVAYVSYSPGRDCVALNVYCIDSLPSERQLLRRECSQNSMGIEVGEQPMIMNANEGDIIVSIRNLPSGWQLTGQSHQSLSYRKVWQNLHPHVTFLLQCAPDTWDSELSCSVHTQQLKTDDQDSSTDISVCCDLAQMEGCSDSSMFENGTVNSGLRAFLRTQTSDYFTPNVFDAGSSMLLHDTESEQIGDDLRELLFNIAWPREVHPPNIPPSLVTEMSSMLDPPNLLGLDWRQLASELDLDMSVPPLTTVGRPTEHLLLAAEALCTGMYELQAKLERMGRDDVSALVRAYIARVDQAVPGIRSKTVPRNADRLTMSSRF